MHRLHVVVVSVVLVIALTACGGGGDSDAPAPSSDDGLRRGGADVIYPEVIPAAEHLASGLFDPSLAYDAGGRGWLAYSSVQPPAIHTHLATSDNRGASWTHVGLINARSIAPTPAASAIATSMAVRSPRMATAAS